MSRCGHCNSEIPDQAKFCPVCGAKVESIPEQSSSQDQSSEQEQTVVSHTTDEQQVSQQPTMSSQQVPPQPVMSSQQIPPQPVMSGQQVPPQPVMSGQQVPPQPVMSGQQVPPQPVMSGQQVPPQPVMSGQQVPPQPVMSGQQVPPQIPNTQQGYQQPQNAQSGGNIPPVAPGYSAAMNTPAPKKNKMLPVFIIGGIILVAILAVVGVLVAGLFKKGDSKDDANLGKWKAVSAELAGISLNVEDSFGGDFIIELKKKGSCTITIGEQKSSGKWTLKDDQINVSGGGLKCSGTLKSGKLILEDVLNTGIQLTFEKEGSDSKTGDESGNKNKDTYYIIDKIEDASGGFTKKDLDNLGMGESGIILYSDGKVFMSLFGKTNKGEYKDGKFIFGSKEVDVKIDGDVLTMEEEGSVTTFKKTDSKPSFLDDSNTTSDPEANSGSAENSNLSESQKYWDGDWYGWVIISYGSGKYEENENEYDDCVAKITMNDDDTGHMTITSLDGTEYLDTDISLGAGVTSDGCIASESGTLNLLGTFDISHADWTVDPGASTVSSIDHMINIYGSVYDEDDDSFDYNIYIRPWGMEWDDVRSADTSNMRYDDMMPVYYDEWYLPAINDGYSMEDVTGDAFDGYFGNTSSEGGSGSQASGGGSGEMVALGYDYSIGIVLPDGFAYDEDSLCYTDSNKKIKIWVDDALLLEDDSMMQYVMDIYSDYQMKDTTMGSYTVHMIEDTDPLSEASTSYIIELGGVGGYVGCKIDVSTMDGTLADVQSQQIKDMIASIGLMN